MWFGLSRVGSDSFRNEKAKERHVVETARPFVPADGLSARCSVSADWCSDGLRGAPRGGGRAASSASTPARAEPLLGSAVGPPASGRSAALRAGRGRRRCLPVGCFGHGGGLGGTSRGTVMECCLHTATQPGALQQSGRAGAGASRGRAAGCRLCGVSRVCSPRGRLCPADPAQGVRSVTTQADAAALCASRSLPAAAPPPRGPPPGVPWGPGPAGRVVR